MAVWQGVNYLTREVIRADGFEMNWPAVCNWSVQRIQSALIAVVSRVLGDSALRLVVCCQLGGDRLHSYCVAAHVGRISRHEGGGGGRD